MENEFDWSAELTDGTIIKEIDCEGKEHLFKEVLDNIDKLKTLTLSWEDKFATVDLTNGHFNINGEDVAFGGLSDRTGVKYRVIYFKRVRQTMSTDLRHKGVKNIKYHLGYQITIDGKNYQRILQIDNLTKEMCFVEKNIIKEPL